jgi:lipopolysaccharide export system protein LptC
MRCVHCEALRKLGMPNTQNRKCHNRGRDMSMLDSPTRPQMADAGARRAAYAEAIRHSARVRRLKIQLPIMAFIISAIFIAVSAVKVFLPENIKIEGAKIENGQIVMEKPAISGRNADGIFYSMTAAKALQDILRPNVINLQAIKAEVPVNEKLIAKVTARSGTYDRDKDTLDMREPFSVNLSSGLNANFRSAYMDVGAGTLVTKDVVSITTTQASIVANSLRIEDKGYEIIFEGRVQVELKPDAIRDKGE